MKLVSAAEMQEIDRRAQEEQGIDASILMEAAALRMWIELSRRYAPRPQRSRVCVVAGKGNNGGDALVIARHAHAEGHLPAVVLCPDESSLSGLAAKHAQICRRLGLPVLDWDKQPAECADTIAAADLVVDGLAGTGVRGALRAPLDSVCATLNESRARIVAVDVPSGLGDEWRVSMPAVRADLTLSVGLPKRSLYAPAARELAGEIVVVPLFAPSLVGDEKLRGEIAVPEDLADILGGVAESAHKGRRGVVALFGGSRGLTGAPILAATAAYHARAGLVTLFVDEDIYPIVAGSVRAVMTRPLVDTDAALDTARTADAIVVGPGWGQGAERDGLLARLLQTGRRGVVDADALNVLAKRTPVLCESWILTPHPGELGRLLGISAAQAVDEMFAHALELARRSSAIVVAKAATTAIAAPDGRLCVVDGMNAALATGGSGDVLAGTIGGLLASGLDAWSAARAGVLVHQMAGRSLRERAGYFLADSLPAEIGRLVDVR